MMPNREDLGRAMPDLQCGVIIQNDAFPEPIRMVLSQPVGTHLKIGGQGIHTGQYHELLLNPDQVRSLKLFQPRRHLTVMPRVFV
jgi:hypothetical protein